MSLEVDLDVIVKRDSGTSAKNVTASIQSVVCHFASLSYHNSTCVCVSLSLSLSLDMSHSISTTSVTGCVLDTKSSIADGSRTFSTLPCTGCIGSSMPPVKWIL